MSTANRAIKRYDLDMILLSGPGHGGNFLIANTYLDGSYSEVYPNISQDEEGMKKMFKQFSFPCGVPSHCAPETPGSINEGGELGYSIAHAFGAVFDNPDLIATVVVGDGEAETGPPGHLLAVQQVPQPHHRWRRAAHPAPERLQDQQPHHLLPYLPRGDRELLQGLRLEALLRRGATTP